MILWSLSGSTITVVLVSFVNLYHCMSPCVLLFNTQVNVVDPPSHTVTSSGSLITVVETSLQYRIISHYT